MLFFIAGSAGQSLSCPLFQLCLSDEQKQCSDPREMILPEEWLYGLIEEFKMQRKRHKAEEIVTKLQ